jgi:hypothetical protein
MVDGIATCRLLALSIVQSCRDTMHLNVWFIEQDRQTGGVRSEGAQRVYEPNLNVAAHL